MRPINFSTYFRVSSSLLDSANLLDAYINTDTPLFIDPLLIEKSANRHLSVEGLSQFKHHFSILVRLLTIAQVEGDPAWLAAERQLSLQEPAENGLGYSKRSRAGAARPQQIRRQLLRTVKAIIQLGSKDPEMLSLMGFLEAGVGSDTISDFTTKAMTDALAQITNDFCVNNGISVYPNSLCSINLPLIPRKGGAKPFVLIPRDVLRDLPITENWSDVWEAVTHNHVLRERVSAMLAGIARPTIEEQKDALKSSVTQSGKLFDEFLSAIKNAATSYDENEDVMGFHAFRAALLSSPAMPRTTSYDVRKGPVEIHRIIMDALQSFKHHVENGNLWEALWAGDQPKRERASQLLFYAIADAYCRANNVDISGEPNMGGGPVDFKFSDGYQSRVLVEMKKSTGTVEHGYTQQLERYKLASQTDHAIFVVMDYGQGAAKIRRIQKLRSDAVTAGQRASEIVIIDTKKKSSASRDGQQLL